MHALRQAGERRRGRILEGANAVDPGACRVHDRARLDGERLAGQAVAHLGAAHATRDLPERDHLGVVRDDATGGGCRPDVGETEPPVVRERVDVDAAAAQSFEPEVGDALQRARGRQQAAEPVTGEPRVEREPESERRRPVGAVTVEREEERQLPDEVRRDGLRGARGARDEPRARA